MTTAAEILDELLLDLAATLERKGRFDLAEQVKADMIRARDARDRLKLIAPLFGGPR